MMVTLAIRRAVVLLAVAVPAAAADHPLVTGYAADESGRRLAGVSVTLRGPGSTTVAATLTDAEGWYRMHAPPGRYELRFRRAAFGAVAKRITVTDAPVLLVNASLRPVSSVPDPAPVLGASSAFDYPVNQITVGGNRLRRTRLGVTPRPGDGRLRVGVETLQLDELTDTTRRYGRLRGMVCYRQGDARQQSWIAGKVDFARRTGAVGDSRRLSLGVSYAREWAPTDRLVTGAGLTAGTASLLGVEWATRYRVAPWLGVDAGLAWSGTREASAGVSLGELRGWTGGVRLHHIAPGSTDDAAVTSASVVVDAEVGRRLTRNMRLLVGVANVTGAPGVDDLDADPIMPRNVRFGVQYGF